MQYVHEKAKLPTIWKYITKTEKMLFEGCNNTECLYRTHWDGNARTIWYFTKSMQQPEQQAQIQIEFQEICIRL